MFPFFWSIISPLDSTIILFKRRSFKSSFFHFLLLFESSRSETISAATKWSSQTPELEDGFHLSRGIERTHLWSKSSSIGNENTDIFLATFFHHQILILLWSEHSLNGILEHNTLSPLQLQPPVKLYSSCIIITIIIFLSCCLLCLFTLCLLSFGAHFFVNSAMFSIINGPTWYGLCKFTGSLSVQYFSSHWSMVSNSEP